MSKSNNILRMIVLLFLISNLMGQGFQDFVNRVENALTDDKSAIVDSFMTVANSFPYIENDSVYFIYRGSAGSVGVPGDATGWNPETYQMEKLPETNFWYFAHIFESDARLDYKYVLNGNNWILDPRNPHQVMGGFGPNSELRMPDYIPPTEINYNSSIPHGTMFDTTFYSTNLENSRKIKVYLPPEYTTSSDSFGVVLVNDGIDYLNLAYAKNVLDNLIANHRIEPVIAVFIPAIHREQEYRTTLQNKFTDFIVEEVIPWIDGKYRTKKDSGSRAVLGASDGGNISLWLSMQHPEVFGNVAAFSSMVETDISDEFQNSPGKDLKIYLDIGTYDIAFLIPLVRDLHQILLEKEYDLLYYEFHDGHSWGNWRGHIDNALEFFFPKEEEYIYKTETMITEFYVGDNYPNPFNSTTTIFYFIPVSSFVELAIYNIAGQKIDTLTSEYKSAGIHYFNWNAGDLSSGVYFYKITYSNNCMIKKCLIMKYF